MMIRSTLTALGIALIFLAAPPEASAQAAGETPPLSTFSIVACDPDTGLLGVGVQSRVVGAGAIVPAARAGVGAIATQALANVAYKEEGLSLLADGLSPAEVRDRFAETDEGIEHRQFAVMAPDCSVAAFTGAETLAWSGHRIGPNYSVQGNILAGSVVLDSMAAAFERAEADALPFGERILAALKAGQDAGGDIRGRQGAGLLIVGEDAGYGGGDDRYADLRVEDHVEPILELERVYGVWMRLFHPADHFQPRGSEAVSAPVGPHICLLRRMLAEAGHGTPPADDNQQCWFDGPVIDALNAFQRAQDLPERPVVDAEVGRRLRGASSP